jgi:hypothetical protein
LRLNTLCVLNSARMNLGMTTSNVVNLTPSQDESAMIFAL